MSHGSASAERWQACTGRYQVSYEHGIPVACDGMVVGLAVPHFACCLKSRLPTSHTRPDCRDPVPADERFLRACGVRPLDVRDELRVLDR